MSGSPRSAVRRRQIVTCPLAALALLSSGCGASAQRPPPLSRWLSSDPAHRTAVLTLVPGDPSPWSPYNFNGYSRDQVLVQVPVGWRVIVHCLNIVSDARHSCAIVANSLSQRPAFPGASTPDPRRGLDPGHSATFSFLASRPGAYRIACLVDDNEIGNGMWDGFQVGATSRPRVLLLRRVP